MREWLAEARENNAAYEARLTQERLTRMEERYVNMAADLETLTRDMREVRDAFVSARTGVRIMIATASVVGAIGGVAAQWLMSLIKA
jgi:hypothetical protein